MEHRKSWTSHANLLVASRIAHENLAERYAKRHLCKNGGEDNCSLCRLIAAGNHPDDIRLSADGNSIRIGAVRNVLSELHKKPYMGQRRCISILGAEDMTLQAQNALLKSIEEPQEGCGFLLLTEDPERLLPTIRSRCTHLRPEKAPVTPPSSFSPVALLMGQREEDRIQWQDALLEKGSLFSAWECGKKALELGFSGKYSKMEETITNCQADSATILDAMLAILSELLLWRTIQRPLLEELQHLDQALLGTKILFSAIDAVYEAIHMEKANVSRRSFGEWLALRLWEELHHEDGSGH